MARIQLAIELVFLLTIFFCSCYCQLTNEQEKETYTALKDIQKKIMEDMPPFCYHSHSGTRNAFLSKAYKKYTGNYNVLVYPFCLQTHELGNRLGNYFTEVACADASGLHFIAVFPQWDLKGSFHGNMTNTTDTRKLAFLKALPDIIVHKHPLDSYNAATKIKHECHCTRYCWGHLRASWVNRTELLGGYLRNSLDAYVAALPVGETTQIDPEVDVSNAQPGQHLPIVPDVALQYRCGDNIAFSYMYGILPFTAFEGRIPADAKYIYVLSDHPSRAVHSPYTSRCAFILKNLFDWLHVKYPSATLVVKRGGDLFLDYVRLGQANTTICSPSSYCFWPAVSSLGTSYFPLTVLIAGAGTKQLAPDFGPNFHWMDTPYISNMRFVRPWTQIIDYLVGKKEIPN
mmetsp:Transcript_24781/g.41289  ORF Transcript_24781/g.41289 Transcript_24781/m.41289 type:complete len:401 (-) Transcript_24781:125-1327(-)